MRMWCWPWQYGSMKGRCNMRDNQRKACYDWEWKLRELYPNACRDIGLEGARQLIVRICDREQIPYPSLGDGRGRSAACYDPNCLTIKLPRWARSPIVVCHEIAHYIIGWELGWHGPQWAWAVSELWEVYAGIPKSVSRKLGREQRPRKVRFKKYG